MQRGYSAPRHATIANPRSAFNSAGKCLLSQSVRFPSRSTSARLMVSRTPCVTNKA